MLFGIAIRTGSPLSLNIAEPVWKQVAGMPLSLSDLAEIDKDWLPGRMIQFYVYAFKTRVSKKKCQKLDLRFQYQMGKWQDNNSQQVLEYIIKQAILV